VKHLKFNDHHNYTASDIDMIANLSKVNKNISYITTEKDKVKLDVPVFSGKLKDLSMFYMPIEIDFLKDGKDFDEIILNLVDDRK
jgi:tetraacyldisaccharide 4'-kinase